MMNKRAQKRENAGPWRLRNIFFELYALHLMHSSLRIRNGEQWETPHYVRIRLRCLGHVFFAYLAYKVFVSRLNAFRRALFCFIVFYGI